MTRCIKSFPLILFLTLSVALAQSQSANQKGDVIRITTELVQTDVTVLDKQGRFVDGLKPEQFELLVDGKPQSISFFERIAAGSRADSTRPSIGVTGTASEKQPAVTDSETPASRGRIVFFFVDDMHLSPDSMYRTREMLKRFVGESMGGGTQAAITSASGQLGFLQQLTSDRIVLNLAIERLKPRSYDLTDMQAPPMTEYQAYAIEQGHPDVKEVFVEQTCKDVLQVRADMCSGAGMTNYAVLDENNARADKRGSSTGGGTRTGGSAVGGNSAGSNQARWRAENIVKQRARVITRQAAQVTLGTLSSLESLVRRAAPLPERKLLIFLSEGFFINFVSSTQVYDLRRITDAASRSGTVIYTIDARGLTSGLSDATKSGMSDNSGRLARINLGEIRAAQQPLFNLADETGGRAWLNSNDLSEGVTKALSETSNYYRLAWQPESETQTKPAFRKLTVRVKDRSDLAVKVAAGFFSDDPELSKTSATESMLSVDDQLMAAIRASYPSRGVPVTISPGYLNTEKDGLVMAASVQIQIPDAGTGSASKFESDVMGTLSDTSGNIVSSLKQEISFVTENNGASSVITLQFPKLVPGLYQVRVAARDRKSGRIGSAAQWIEIPKSIQDSFSISSIFLSEGPLTSSGTAQKWTIKPNRAFSRTSKLRFQAFVYNADRSAGAPRLQLQLELHREGQLLIQTPPTPVSTDGVDPQRIPLQGEFPLEGFASGRYELKVTLTDLKTKSAVSQQTNFVVH
ncbi:MAG TPA: VWA domain-containing protein [Pyrinomonadaceae bacterium]|nr:VWA domain-containing protein [Pyrinomonadaceae bacterium]